MNTTELLKKVRKIEIKTRGISRQIFSGEYHSAFKGRGMAFSEVREYQLGDEIRTIDWNVTARFNHPYVKVFEEEREISVMLLVDVSASQNVGSGQALKSDLVTEICAVLAFSAIQNNDKVGILFFSDKIEKFIPPKKGKSHILRIIRELIDFEPENKGTNIKEALTYFNQVIKKRSIAFLISDFNDSNYEKLLTVVGKKHDLVAVYVEDQIEETLPDLGFIALNNAETNEVVWLNSNAAKNKNILQQYYKTKRQEIDSIFKKSGIDYTTICTRSSYIQPLMRLFKKREMRR